MNSESSDALPIVLLKHNRPLLAKATEAALMSRSLADFVREAWPIVEGNRPLEWGWHLDAVIAHLQALADGALPSRKLIINIPPRTSKSTLVTIMLPCWIWTTSPHLQFMFASYSFSLSRDHAYKRRAILESAWYKELWGEKGTGIVTLSDDRQNIVEMSNRARGLMFSTSVGGTVTGRGADWLILDDPNDAASMESEVQRASVLRWLDVTWSTRANNPNTVREICIQQRTHTEDVTGHLLKSIDWTLVKLPMIFNRGATKPMPCAVDPRSTDGELLAPTRFPQAYIDEQRRRLGPYAWAGQFLQEPYPLGGGIIKAAWLKRWKDSDRIAKHIQVMDGLYHFDPFKTFRFATVDPAVAEKAIGEKKLNDPDYTILAAWCALSTPQGALLCLMDLVRERMEGPDIIPRLAAMHKHWRFAVIGIETVAFQLSLFQQARRHPFSLPVREISTKNDDEVIYRIDKDKVARAMAATPLMAAGRLFIPEYAPWLSDYIAELVSFPNAAHDDCVDATAFACAIADKYTGQHISGLSDDKPELTLEERQQRDRRLQDVPRDPMAHFYGNRPPGV